MGRAAPPIDSRRTRRARRSQGCWLLAGGLVVTVLSLGCGGSSNGPIGTVDGTIVPCDQGEPSFDVWRADFDPSGAAQIVASIDTRDDTTTAELRLVIACNGEVVLDTIGGIDCSFTPPAKRDGGKPQCPLGKIQVAALGTARVECLAEITSTEPLDIGVGRCADPAIAKYTFRMTLDDRALALDLAADDCRDASSCLERQFGIDVNS
jgi:hypothetical protein